VTPNVDEGTFLPEDAESGEVHAQFDLAMRYSTGDGVPKSDHAKIGPRFPNHV
jgi:hypothetical protein